MQRGAEQVEEAARYDGIWACASLVHLDQRRLDAAMERLSHALKRDGRLYMSFKDGSRIRKAADGRLFNDMSSDALGQLARDHGLVVEDSWRSKSKLQGTNEAEWNNVIARKVG